MKKVRRVYQTGNFREVRDVWVTDRYVPRGPRLKGNARKSQMDANMKAAIRESTRILNGNFCYAHGDLLCTYTFTREPEDRNEGWKLFAKHGLDKLRKLARSNGRELKMYAVVSDMDGRTKAPERIHIHAVLSGVTMEQAREVWKLGVVDCRTIRKEKTHARLARYLLEHCRCAPNEKKWHTSRNLERTKLLSETEVHGNPRYRMPKGAELIAQGEYSPEEGKLLDLQILMPERDAHTQRPADRPGTPEKRRRKKT